MGSILTPILFQTFLNDPFLCLTKSDLHNAADGNVISVTQQPLEMFCKKVVIKKLKEKFYNFFSRKINRKTPVSDSPFNKVAGPCEFCELLRVAFLQNTSKRLLVNMQQTRIGDTVILSNFQVWKFCGKAQFLYSFGRITQNFAETVTFRKIK